MDDDPLVLQSLERGLLDESYNKLFAKSGKEALEIIKQKEVHVIVADMYMPEMTGLELLRHVRKECPGVIGMVLSGYEQDAELQNAVEQGEISQFVSKPWEFRLVDLKSLVRRAIDSCGKCTCERLGIMSNEEKPQVPKEPQQTSLKENQETPSEPYQEKPAEIESESSGYDGSESNKWGNKMEVQRSLSSKPDLEIEEKKTVLFVDDDEGILRSLERGLLDESYNKLFAKSGKEALEIIKQKEVQVIVADMCMPEMAGLELIRIARREYPNIIGIIITGYELDDELQKAVDNREVFRLVTKPLWKLGGKFEKLIRWALVRSNLQSECNTVGSNIVKM